MFVSPFSTKHVSFPAEVSVIFVCTVNKLCYMGIRIIWFDGEKSRIRYNACETAFVRKLLKSRLLILGVSICNPNVFWAENGNTNLKLIINNFKIALRSVNYKNASG